MDLAAIGIVVGVLIAIRRNIVADMTRIEITLQLGIDPVIAERSAGTSIEPSVAGDGLDVEIVVVIHFGIVVETYIVAEACVDVDAGVPEFFLANASIYAATGWGYCGRFR